jgi:DNA-binding transcriptional ArsR family regulator
MAEPTARFAFSGLDRLFHEKARLGIVTSLAGHGKGLAFGELKSLCGLTDGNLSRHLQVLEEAGVVAINKGFEGKRPLTSCSLTETGRQRFDGYLAYLEAAVREASAAVKANDLSKSLRTTKG